MKTFLFAGLFSVVFGLCFASAAWAGKYNPEVNIGETAPEFADLPGVDGKKYSLKDLTAPVVVVVFTCNSCPYAVDYEKRLREFYEKYSDKDQVAVIAINSNLTREDSLEKMQQRAEERKYPYPYVFDETQQTAKSYGALRTPEFFVLDQDRKIVYMGAFDDHTDASQVGRQHVNSAVDSLLAEEKITLTETPPIGCLIRFKRSRSR